MSTRFHHSSSAPEGLIGSLGIYGAALVRRSLDALLRWQELARQRRALLELDERMLRDLGLTRADAMAEARRPFWDDPHAPRW